MNFLPIPNTAPFAEEEIVILNRVMGSASPTQRAWLAGFIAGMDAATTAPQPAGSAQTTEPLTILYATESGNSEQLAADIAKAARKLGLKPSIVDMADLDVATLASVRRLVVIAATWGEGEPPARVIRAYAELMGEGAPRLDDVRFGVLALGDTAYAKFCAIGKALDARLAALGGKRVVARVDCDLDFAEPAGHWIETALKALAPAENVGQSRIIAVDFAAKATSSADLAPVEAEITELIHLNSSQSEKVTIHLELSFDGAAPPYKPGDSLDIYPENDAAYVDDLLEATGLASDVALRAELIKARDVTTLSLKTLASYAATTNHPQVKALLASEDARTWIAGRQLIDLLQLFPVALSADQLRQLTRPLAPRAYSIASSRREVGDEVHLLISAVRYQSFGRVRKGVASGHVADQLKKGQRLRVKLRPNRHFALPAPERDIIMVGPGTGIAPFRAFVQERRATAASGRSWLFFGDRQFTHDFLYQLEWQDALKDGSLTRMNLAFSRDTPHKRYVQHLIWEQRQDLIDWLDNGAYFYVCGDAKAMAKDVRAALVRAYVDVKALSVADAEQAVKALDREHRYLQDIY
ncbi:flavodoxin domain-containing protein [Pseudomonas sp. RTC3]|uniref:diflavin oxidoreductase n=1 Tax=unclassified Pseudomonas TaxID=196821 RepID=UPI002AB37300|nr:MULTISPECIES: flavodoxin domain-containing protein [unclassified Pseudomonas]MEB0063875.1 flavodoxin domain-containing protein [Pseudomonas sp. RTC3]MDY7565028.1 flavodoxin domain-containing protein [Pseudomonas sp. 5C2]MEB0025249.1 flavodoxin domain-containing protein [Pseudomonas sp. MH9.2]MEB0242187.1 flavodoxin domain-containing protein [Pseudomonas sp. 5C2]WPX69139.1 flavodoxin domain-containing protein [Pseudomonas sp. MH9.2]